MAQLKLYKVNAEPASPEPDAVYFIVKPDKKFEIKITSKTGEFYESEGGNANLTLDDVCKNGATTGETITAKNFFEE